MELTTYKVLTGLAYITLIFIATFVSWKKGEKVGSVFMLQYLRENKFMNENINSVRNTYEFIIKNCKTKPIILVPNELFFLISFLSKSPVEALKKLNSFTKFSA